MKKKFNIKLYGNKGFNLREKPYLISTTNFYLELYEEDGWYKTKKDKTIKVENDIFVKHVIVCYKTMEIAWFDEEVNFEKGGDIILSNIEIDKLDFDFVLSGKPLRIKFE